MRCSIVLAVIAFALAACVTVAPPSPCVDYGTWVSRSREEPVAHEVEPYDDGGYEAPPPAANSGGGGSHIPF